MEKTCPVCGKSFEIGYKQHRKVYCSKECYRKSQAEKRKRENPKISKVCLWCRKPFQTNQIKIRKYCCRLCSDTYRYMHTRILKTIQFNDKLRDECLRIFEQNGLNSVFPVDDLNATLKEVITDYKRKLKKYV